MLVLGRVFIMIIPTWHLEDGIPVDGSVVIGSPPCISAIEVKGHLEGEQAEQPQIY